MTDHDAYDLDCLMGGIRLSLDPSPGGWAKAIRQRAERMPVGEMDTRGL